MNSNEIVVTFSTGATTATSPVALWQYDYGQILHIIGLNLPTSYEVQFCNYGDSTTVTSIGNADGVTIPDQFLRDGRNILAYIFLHAGEDDGETEYKITIPVLDRSEPTDIEPTPAQESTIGQLITELNSAVDEAESIAASIPTAIGTALEEAKASGEFDGPPGDDGISPTVTVTDITGGHRVTITDADGDHTFDVMDGESVGSDDVYWVTPGVDSYADIVSLQAQNKLLAISYDSRIYTLQYIENEYAWFCSSASGKFYYLKCRARNSSWGASSAIPYSKPSDGIPKTDLASGVRTSLEKADTAYQKPSGGIPASDLESGVIPSVPSASSATPQALGTAAAGSSTDYSRADHVHAKPTYSKSDVGLGNVDNVQQYSANNPPPYPVSSVNGQTGAVSLTIPSTAADVGAIAAPSSPASGAFLVWNGSAWVAQTLATWQASSY